MKVTRWENRWNRWRNVIRKGEIQLWTWATLNARADFMSQSSLSILLSVIFVCYTNLLHVFEFNNLPPSCSDSASVFPYNQLTEMLCLLCSLITSLNTTNSKLTWDSFLFSCDLTAEPQHKPRSVSSSYGAVTQFKVINIVSCYCSQWWIRITMCLNLVLDYFTHL